MELVWPYNPTSRKLERIELFQKIDSLRRKRERVKQEEAQEDNYDLKNIAGFNWYQVALSREKWKKCEENIWNPFINSRK